MPKKKVDARVRTLIENGVHSRTRSFVVLVGDRGKDQVASLHYILSKAQVKARPSVLWCYSRDLGFSTHRQKRMRQIKKLQAKGLYNSDKGDGAEAGGDPFDLFISSTNIRWCYYKETQRILGQTFGMLVLQDFDAITPNILCRAIETVEGGGVVVLLLRTMSSLRQLYSLSMEVHHKFRTEAHQTVVPRFNERFLLSLLSCPVCLVLDDELNVLPVSKHAKSIVPLVSAAAAGAGAAGVAKGATADDLYGMAGLGLAEAGLVAEAELSPAQRELRELKSSLAKTALVGALVGCTRTLDQARAVLTFAEGIAEMTLRTTVALTAGRGRGKSAALGLAMAAAIGYGYSNIFVTSPSPENLETLFEFVFKGLEALSYREHADYEAVASTRPEFNRSIVRVNVFRGHRQTIQYLEPGDSDKLSQAELVVVDEAAAIPLPLVKKLLGPYLVFLSSTVNGYEGTGRSLSLKLVQQLRMQQANGASGGGSTTLQPGLVGGGGGVAAAAASAAAVAAAGRAFREVALHEPIRYASGDGVERWLTDLLCLDATTPPRLAGRLPAPSACELYAVDRNSLFSYHRVSEAFLHRMMALYVASHYKNSPNDLQLVSDAPAHRLFVLLGPQEPAPAAAAASADGSVTAPPLPDILCVVQVCLEGRISAESMRQTLQRGARSSGDLIPWTVSQQFQDERFGMLSGARVVRIATHPDALKMGYGSRALELLATFYEGRLAAGGPSRAVSLGSRAGAVADEDAEVEEEDGVEFEGALPLQRDDGSAAVAEGVDDNDDDTAAGAEAGRGGAGTSAPPVSRLLREKLRPRRSLSPLLVPLASMRSVERLHWLGSSFGLTLPLFSFWRRAGYLPLYLRQTANDLTAEHTVIMLRPLQGRWQTAAQAEANSAVRPGKAGGKGGAGTDDPAPAPGWHRGFVADFGRRFASLLGYEFRSYDVTLALSVMDAACSVTMPGGALGGGAGVGAGAGAGQDEDADADTAAVAAFTLSSSSSSSVVAAAPQRARALSPQEVALLFTPHDLQRLESYARNLVDYHMVLDLLPAVARLFFAGRLGAVHLPRLQAGILLALGLQHATVDAVAQGLGVAASQVLALFNKALRKASACLSSVVERRAARNFDARVASAQGQGQKHGQGSGMGADADADAVIAAAGAAAAAGGLSRGGAKAKAAALASLGLAPSEGEVEGAGASPGGAARSKRKQRDEEEREAAFSGRTDLLHKGGSGKGKRLSV